MSSHSHDRHARRNEVFARVFDEHWAPVRHHIEWMLDDDVEVTEVVSEVFLFAWSKLDPDRPMGLIWLLRAADRKLKGRPRRPRPGAKVLDALQEGMGAEGGSSASTDRTAILSAFTALSARERRIIMLTYWDGLAAGEIAEMLRRPRSRVSRTLSQAEEKLRGWSDTEGAGGRHG